jgi:hypothetical protein
MIFVATKNGRTKKFRSPPSSFGAVVGSGINKRPGSETLSFTYLFLFFQSSVFFILVTI